MIEKDKKQNTKAEMNEEYIDPHVMEAAIKRVMKMLGAHYGADSEFILHSYENGPESTVIAIENNKLTGRKIGDPSSNLGFELLRYEGKSEINDSYGYNVFFKNGKVFRSSTLYIKDEQGKMIGAFCINTDVTPLLSMRSYIDALSPSDDSVMKIDEFFPHDVNELLDTFIEDFEKTFDGDAKNLSKLEKKNAVKYFDAKGAFLISKAGPRICEYLDISKATLYTYLSDIRNEKENN